MLDVQRIDVLCYAMIRSYRERDTQHFAEGRRVPHFEPFRQQAEKRLRILEAATGLRDLAQLPSNRFEALAGDREGQYSIRINKQWRICFAWPSTSDGPEHVEIVDYH
jgi:toxin HigB-1